MIINDFIKRYKNVVEFDVEKKVHWLGAFILTNEDMHKQCLNLLDRDDYELRTHSERRKIRENIFRQLRGGADG